MDCGTIIAERYNYIIENKASSNNTNELRFIDKSIFYIVSLRCEIDINGNASIFEQLFDE